MVQSEIVKYTAGAIAANLKFAFCAVTNVARFATNVQRKYICSVCDKEPKALFNVSNNTSPFTGASSCAARDAPAILAGALQGVAGSVEGIFQRLKDDKDAKGIIDKDFVYLPKFEGLTASVREAIGPLWSSAALPVP